MVKELQAKAPEPSISWEEQTQMFYELAVEGIPLPEKLEKVLEDRFKIFLGDRDPAMVKAEREWDIYFLWKASHPEVAELTPGRRLQACFGSQQ